MNSIELGHVGPGFADPSLGSQAVFRTLLQALSRPGRIQTMSADTPVPAGVHCAAALALLALLDQDCTLWLSPSLQGSPAAVWLRFHTGCQLVERPDQAQFAWVASVDELPALEAFAWGSEFEPEKSTTCLVQTQALQSGHGWTLRGPGIDGFCRLAVAGLADEFAAQWGNHHGHFPSGVDLLFCAGERLAGLPRTTQIER